MGGRGGESIGPGEAEWSVVAMTGKGVDMVAFGGRGGTAGRDARVCGFGTGAGPAGGGGDAMPKDVDVGRSRGCSDGGSVWGVPSLVAGLRWGGSGGLGGGCGGARKPNRK